MLKYILFTNLQKVNLTMRYYFSGFVSCLKSYIISKPTFKENRYNNYNKK